MKTVSSLLQTLALGALLAAQIHGAITMPGVRKALRIIGTQPSPVFCVSSVRAGAIGYFGEHRAALGPCP